MNFKILRSTKQQTHDEDVSLMSVATAPLLTMMEDQSFRDDASVMTATNLSEFSAASSPNSIVSVIQNDRSTKKVSLPSQDQHIEAVTQIIQKQKQANQRLLQQQQEQQDHQRRILQQQLQQEQQRLQQRKEKTELLQKQQMQAKQRYQFEEQKKMQDKLPLQQKEPEQQRYQAQQHQEQHQSSKNNQVHEQKLQWTKPKTVTTTTLVEAVRNRQLCGVVTTEPVKSGQLTMTVHCSGPAFSDDSSVSYTEPVVEGMLFQVCFYVLLKRRELTCLVSL